MTTGHQPRSAIGGLRAVIGLFVLATCLWVWVGPGTILEPARAQIPDSGMQRKLLLEEARQTNLLLTEIKQLLKDHTFNVRIEGADNQADAPAIPRRGGR